MNKNAMAPALFFALVVWATVWIVNRTLPSWDQRLERLVRISHDVRNPAAMGRVFNVSHLHGGALFQAASERIIKIAKWHQAAGAYGVQLGHFVTKDEENRPILACEYYDRVEMIFAAEGVAENGHAPVMAVDGACAISDDPNNLETIWIPISSIKERAAKDSELMSVGPQSLHFRFQHIPPKWPRTWYLTGVRLYNKQVTERNLSIDSQEIHRVLGKPMVMSWESNGKVTR